MDLIGAHVARPEESARFGSQARFAEDSLGAHKIAKMKPVHRILFLAWCPEGRTILPRGFARMEFAIALALRRVGLARLLTRTFRGLRRVRRS